jgi:hypothetical protein
VRVRQLQVHTSFEKHCTDLHLHASKVGVFEALGDRVQVVALLASREQQHIYERLSTGPRDQSRELDQLRNEAERLKDSLQRQRRIAADAEKQLASMGAIAKARRKWEVDLLRNRIRDAGKVEERLKQKLREMADAEKQMTQAQKEREQWVKQQGLLVDRAQVIESELAIRNKVLLRDRENSLPKYLENTVGPVPERPSERAEWRQAVLAIEDYRGQYGIKDRNRALGGEPRNADQRWDREQAERTIEEANDRRLGRSQDRDDGLERSLELSP